MPQKPIKKAKPTSRRTFLKTVAVGAAGAITVPMAVVKADAAPIDEVAPELPWRVYATCPECNGVVASVTLGEDPANQMRDAEAKRMRAAGFNAFKVRQAKTFDTGHRLKKDCKHSHEFQVD